MVFLVPFAIAFIPWLWLGVFFSIVMYVLLFLKRVNFETFFHAPSLLSQHKEA
jgi:hypothetical protein